MSFFFKGSSTRPLRFAGTWYQSDGTALTRQMQSYFDEALSVVNKEKDRLAREKREILAVVAPHAGLSYSGQTAAYSYLALDKNIKRVFLLGPSHYAGFRMAGFSGARDFATLSSGFKVDTSVVAKFEKSALFSNQTAAHEKEHALELQLPYLESVAPDVQIVPLLIGRLENSRQAREIAAVIKSELGPGDLIVVSSDFTHFGPRFDYTPFEKDREKLRKLDMEAAAYLEKCDLEGFFEFHQRTGDTICGVYALSVLLALLPADSRGDLLDYRTSLEAADSDDENSVSYMSLIFSSSDGFGKKESISKESATYLLSLARETVEKAVRGESLPTPDYRAHPELKNAAGAFVTLHQKKGGVRNLRGCIGYIMPVEPLGKTVVDNARSAALRDPRFTPVTPGELADIDLEITILTPPREVASIKEIQIGRDGILLKKSGRQSVFLPQVATEQGWTLEETLTQLALKAGLPPDGWRNGATFETFQGFSLEEP